MNTFNIENQDQRKEFAKKLKLDYLKEYPFEVKGLKAVELRYVLDDYFLAQNDLTKITQSKIFTDIITKPELVASLFLDKTDQELVVMSNDESLDDKIKDMVIISQFFRENRANIDKLKDGGNEIQEGIQNKLQNADYKLQKAMFTFISQNPELLNTIDDFNPDKNDKKDYLKKKIREYYFTALNTAQSILNTDIEAFNNLDVNEYNYFLDCLNLENSWGFSFFTKM